MGKMGKMWRTYAQGKMGGGWVLDLKAVGMAAGIAFLASVLISFLFYNSFWGMCSLPFTLFLTGKYWKEEEEKKKKNRLNLEFKDYMYAVASALLAGNSLERAFLGAKKDVKQLYGDECLLENYLGGMERRLHVQEPLEAILRDFADESKSEDIENFVEIFCHAKRNGGDFIQIITTSVGRICDKIEVLEEIHTVMAEKALEQKIMCIVPLGILLFFRATSPEFIGRLYGNLLGIFLMTVALLLYGIAFFLGKKMVEIEV